VEHMVWPARRTLLAAIALGLAGIFAAISTSSAAETSDDLVQLVVGLLGEQDKDLRALGLEQVRTGVPGEAATRQFAAQLPKLSADAQEGLIRALADRGDAAARPAVLAMLTQSKEESVQVAAVSALGFLGESGDVPRLVERLASSSKPQQAAARASLVRLRGEETPKAIVGQMKTSVVPVQVALIEILAARRALDTKDDLLRAAVADDPKVRAAAMKALGQLAGPDQVAGMVAGVLRAEPGSERSAAEKCIMFVCLRTADADKRADPLLAAMDKLSADDRTAMLSTLGRVGGAKARKVIEAAVSDPDPALHEIGLRALCNWPDASIAPRLIELVKTAKAPEHRTRALRALIRVAPLPDDRPDLQRLELLKQAVAMCQRDEDRLLALQRAAAIRTPETLRYVLPFVDQPQYAEQACETIVELAHHRTLRQPNKAEFDRALDKVLATSQDAVVKDRATRYKNDQTWVRPKK